MLDVVSLRKDLDLVVKALEKRKSPQPFLDVSAFQDLETKRKTIQVQTEALQAQRNALSKQIGQLKSKGESADAVMAEVASIKDALDTSAAELDALQAPLQALLMAVPNLPQDDVPVGADEAANVELRRWSPSGGLGGNATPLPFPPKDHVDVGEPFGLDFELGVKLSGSRFSVLRGPVARLHRALAAFMLDTQTEKHGYTECYTPYAVNAASLIGTGQLPKFEADLFAAIKGGQDGDTESLSEDTALYLIPTSEVPLTNFVRDTIIPEADLPLKFTAHTPCLKPFCKPLSCPTASSCCVPVIWALAPLRRTILRCGYPPKIPTARSARCRIAKPSKPVACKRALKVLRVKTNGFTP
jgi:seryl-tRNA synthetase